jgi:hypothetical protein
VVRKRGHRNRLNAAQSRLARALIGISLFLLSVVACILAMTHEAHLLWAALGLGVLWAWTLGATST